MGHRGSCYDLYQSVLPMFSFRSFIVSGLIFRSLIHFEFIFVYSVRKCSEVKSLSHVQLCDPMDYSPSSSSVHGILQARILEWINILFSKGSSQPRDRIWVSHVQGDSLPSEPPRKTLQNPSLNESFEEMA